MRRRIVTVVLVIVALALVGVWPGFSQPSHRAKDCQDGSTWGYDVPGRSWTCSDNWLVLVGNHGVTGI